MKNRLVGGALAALALLCALQVQAADNYAVKDGSGATITLKAKEVGGVKAVTHTVANSDGVTLIDPATAANQATLNNHVDTLETLIASTNTKIDTLDAAMGSPFQAGGSIGNTAFGATQLGTWNITNITGAVSLPTGAATAANQSTANGHLSTLAGAVSAGNINVICTSGCSGGGGGSSYSVLNASTYANSSSYSNVPSGGLVTTAAPTFTNGQASPLSLTTAGGLRVTDAAVAAALGSPFQAGGSIGNSSFGATQSGTWNITNVSGTVSLPTGAATAALQTTANGYLDGLEGLLGGTLTVGLPSGAATAAKQPALGTAGSSSSDVISVQGVAGGTPLIAATTIANPTSVLTRPANTTAYAAGDLVASSTTAGSIVVPAITVTRISGGSVTIPRLRLNTNATSGWGGVNIQIDLFAETAPTFTNGDNGVYAVATGAGKYVGTATVSLTQFADGAVGTATIADGPINLKLASGSSLYGAFQILSTATPISGQTFTLTLEGVQN